MDLNQLLQAMSQVQAPGHSQAQVQGMLDEAGYLRERAMDRRSQPWAVGGSGASSAAAAFMRQRTADMRDREALGTLRQAYDAQSGIDQYQAQVAAITQQIEALQKQQAEREKFDYETKAKHQNALALQEMKNKRGPQTVVNVGDQSEAQQTQTALMDTGQTLDTIDRAMANVSATTTGYGGLLSNLPATSARTLRGDIDTIQANLAFDRLQKMRDQSKTGGALGQVSERELKLLQGAVASLDQLQKPDDLRERLSIVDQSYRRFMSALNGTVPEGYNVQEMDGARYIQIDDKWYSVQ